MNTAMRSFLTAAGIWLSLVGPAGADDPPPFGGIGPYFYLFPSINLPEGITYRRDLSGPPGRIDYRDVIAGWTYLTSTDEYVPSSPIVFFADGLVVRYSFYAYHESVVTMRDDPESLLSPPVLGSLNGGNDAVFMFDKSSLTMTGGTVRRPIRGFDDSTVSVTGGTINSLIGRDNSTLEMTGGGITGSGAFEAHDHSRVTVSASGLVLPNAAASGAGQLTLSDVVVASLGTAADQSAYVFDNTIVRSLAAAGNATITHTGGAVTGSVAAAENSTISVDNAPVSGDADATGSATLTLNQVNLSGLATARDTSTLGLTNVDIGGELAARDSSTVSVVSSKVKALGAANQGTATMTIGEVATNVVAIDDARITAVASTVGGGAAARGHATVNLIGGQVKGEATGGDPLGLYATDFGTVDVDGTEVRNGAEVNGVAAMNLRSGRIVGDLLLRGAGTAQLGNGFEVTRSVDARDTAVLTMSGGAIYTLQAAGSSRATITGGKVDSFVYVREQASVSIADIDGGTFGGGASGQFGPSLSSSGSSEVTITGGKLFGVESDDDSRVAIAGGTIRGVTARGNSQVAISRGNFAGSVRAQGSAFLSFRGGEIDVPLLQGFSSLYAREDSEVSFTSGTIGDDLEASGHARVTVGGGIVGKNLEGYDQAVVDMTAGRVFGAAIFRDDSTLNYSGGTIFAGIVEPPFPLPGARAMASSMPADQSAVSIEEAFASAIFLYDNARLNVIGTDLVATLIDGNLGGASSLYRLSGRLRDGTLLEGQFFALQNGSGASFQFTLAAVPLPPSIVFFLPAVALLLRRSARRRSTDRDLAMGAPAP